MKAHNTELSRRNQRWLMPITWRFAVLITILVLLSSIFAAVINDWCINRAFHQEKQRRLGMLADTVIDSIKEAWSLMQMQEMERIIEGMCEREPDVEDLVITACRSRCREPGEEIIVIYRYRDKARSAPYHVKKLRMQEDLKYVTGEYSLTLRDEILVRIHVGYSAEGVLAAERARVISGLAGNIANGVGEPISRYDFARAIYSAEHIIGNNPDIKRLQLININGKLIYDSLDKNALGKNVPRKDLEAAFIPGGSKDVIVHEEGTGPNKVLKISALIKHEERTLGVARLVYSMRSMYIEDIKRRALVSVVWLLFAGVGFAACAIVSKRLTVQIRQLSDIALEVGKGDLEVRPHVRTHAREIHQLAEAFNKMIAGLKERNVVKETFSRYVTRQVAEEILRAPEKIAPGGARQEVTVVFSDIRGFTAYSERHSPEQVLSQLNEYLSAMIDVIFRYEGTLDKFIGDSIMAVFGSPIPHGDDPLRAARTALEMQERLAGLNEKWSREGKERLKIGIGINTGEAIVGNIGDERRLEYTVIGDNVNLASRIEGLTKSYNCGVMISAGTYETIKEMVNVRSLGAAAVKGKSQAIEIYELLGLKTSDNSNGSNK
ncbi:MAG: adenylate/guanylate cyclase domain-containing protein [bacterium]